MPSREKRSIYRKKKSDVLPILISVCILAAAILIVMVMRTPQRDNAAVAVIPENPNFDQQTGAPLVVHRDAATPEPETTPVPEETQEAGALEIVPENRLLPTPQPFDNFIPVCERALRTPDDKKMIAVTIDDCGNRDRLYEIARIAYKYNCKLTLFPYGAAMMKDDIRSLLYYFVRSLGYELENHGYNAREEYKMTEGELLLQIWKQSVAASYVVGKDYKQHFFRPYNRNSNYDQRTHYYVSQLNIPYIGGFTHSYQNYESGAALAKTLDNGKIYSFDMNKKTLEVFEDFLIEVNNKGYEMVTMNELFGLEDNEVGEELTIDQQEFPEIPAYVPTYYDLNVGYRTTAVQTLQNRLNELCFAVPKYTTIKDDMGVEHQKAVLPEADGIYGESTSVAVSSFQGAVGIAATGNADVETQEALFAPDAPVYKRK